VTDSWGELGNSLKMQEGGEVAGYLVWKTMWFEVGQGENPQSLHTKTEGGRGQKRAGSMWYGLIGNGGSRGNLRIASPSIKFFIFSDYQAMEASQYKSFYRFAKFRMNLHREMIITI
jgi:hypothetical protein